MPSFGRIHLQLLDLPVAGPKGKQMQAQAGNMNLVRKTPVAKRNYTPESEAPNAPSANPTDLQGLARGLSHEILNPLAGIKAALAVLHETEQLSQHGHGILSEINLEIEQIDHVIRQFLEFAFCPEPHIQNLPLDALVESVRDYLGPKPNFEIRLSAPKRLHVRGDLAMLQKVLLELVHNSANHGAHLATVAARAAKGKVVICVRNSGAPIETEVAPRIFEPFFSTRPRRAGLGLPIVQRRLAAMKGTIKLLPTRDGFQITLPRGK